MNALPHLHCHYGEFIIDQSDVCIQYLEMFSFLIQRTEREEEAQWNNGICIPWSGLGVQHILHIEVEGN